MFFHCFNKYNDAIVLQRVRDIRIERVFVVTLTKKFHLGVKLVPSERNSSCKPGFHRFPLFVL